LFVLCVVSKAAAWLDIDITMDAYESWPYDLPEHLVVAVHCEL
jgi:hypothetical protein